MLSDFQEDFRALRGLMADFAAYLDEPLTVRETPLFKDRVTFSRLFRAHMLRLDAVIRLLRSSTDRRVDEVMRGIAAMQALQIDYSAHLRAWSPREIGERWSEYRVAVLALQHRLRDLLEMQERALLPLLRRDAA